MVEQLSLIKTSVFHKRCQPKINAFTYHTYYLSVPLQRLSKLKSNLMLGINKSGLMSFHNKDHGSRDGADLKQWLTEQYANCQLEPDHHVVLIAMPRIMGYVFNPISFWLNFNEQKQLTSVLCEVNNTYGEGHNYICAEVNQQIIDRTKWYQLDKCFHVSPFLPREGRYAFNFDVTDHQVRICIRYYDQHDQLALTTSLTGQIKPFSRLSALKLYCVVPLMTFKVIGLIYWQAVKLKLKGLLFRNKPAQLAVKTTSNVHQRLNQ